MVAAPLPVVDVLLVDSGKGHACQRNLGGGGRKHLLEGELDIGVEHPVVEVRRWGEVLQLRGRGGGVGLGRDFAFLVRSLCGLGVLCEACAGQASCESYVACATHIAAQTRM